MARTVTGQVRRAAQVARDRPHDVGGGVRQPSLRGAGPRNLASGQSRFGL